MVKVLRELKMKGFSISWWFRDAIIRLINKDYGVRNIPTLHSHNNENDVTYKGMFKLTKISRLPQRNKRTIL